MTTLAIIGGGIAGRSLLYNLTTLDFSFDKILFFESEAFAPPCALNSTAIVAPRGVTKGHSPLGDLIFEGLEVFQQHVKEDSPQGVHAIFQYTGSEKNSEQFLKRYPSGHLTDQLREVKLRAQFYINQEEGFLIDPPVYLDWLLLTAEKKLKVTRIKDFVIGIEEGERVKLHTQGGKSFEAQHVAFATGAASRFWKNLFSDSILSSSKPSQGSYLEFTDVDWKLPSFSVTLEGHNLIYHSHSKKLLIGSTTTDSIHSLAPRSGLKDIYEYLRERMELELPTLESGKIKVGLREKARKRGPYVFTQGRISFVGGFYKNGMVLSLKMTRSLARQLPSLF